MTLDAHGGQAPFATGHGIWSATPGAGCSVFPATFGTGSWRYPDEPACSPSPAGAEAVGPPASSPPPAGSGAAGSQASSPAPAGAGTAGLQASSPAPAELSPGL